MADLIFIAVICAFFALCVLYIRWCDRMIGPDDFAAEPAATTATDNTVPPSLTAATAAANTGITSAVTA